MKVSGTTIRTTIKLARTAGVAAALWCLLASQANAFVQYVHPITGYGVTILNPKSDGTLFGWIELFEGSKDAGYIYLDDGDKSLPSGGSNYIVMHMPWSQLGNLLAILNGSVKMQIRLFDPQTAGVPPTAFIEPIPRTTGTNPSVGAAAEHDNIAKHIPGMQ